MDGWSLMERDGNAPSQIMANGRQMHGGKEDRRQGNEDVGTTTKSQV